MNSIKYIRLVTGEDIISEVLEVNGEPHVTLYNPMKLLYTFEGESKIRMQLIEWIFSNLVVKNIFALKRRDILIMEDAAEGITSAYSEQTSETSLNELLSSRSRKNLD